MHVRAEVSFFFVHLWILHIQNHSRLFAARSVVCIVCVKLHVLFFYYSYYQLVIKEVLN